MSLRLCLNTLALLTRLGCTRVLMFRVCVVVLYSIVIPENYNCISPIATINKYKTLLSDDGTALDDCPIQLNIASTVSLTFPRHSHTPSLCCTVTNLTHQISPPRISDDCPLVITSWAPSSISRLNKLPRPRHVPPVPVRSFPLFHITAEVVTARDSRGRFGSSRDARNGYP